MSDPKQQAVEAVMEALAGGGDQPDHVYDRLADQLDSFWSEALVCEVNLAVGCLRAIPGATDPDERRALTDEALGQLNDARWENGWITLEEELEVAASYDGFLRELGAPLDDKPFPGIQ